MLASATFAHPLIPISECFVMKSQIALEIQKRLHENADVAIYKQAAIKPKYIKRS